ncbi:MAG TPA: Uma2 family endonuclease [Gemmataceae bacterium]|jgi:Uma2 family endonuclease|nr:Uma2 family endonuclease [Gemmataceae bacterium]
MIVKAPATIDDLYKTEGKAELIAGRIVPIMPTGRKHNRVSSRIFRSLDDYAIQCRIGEAYTDNMGFRIPILPSGRESFSPDASYYNGVFPVDEWRFIDGPPTFAVEVRSEDDYGPAAELALAEKRGDYFQAGTLAVWDVDPANETVMLYRAGDPANPIVFHRGDVAHAEPAVPGWTMSVDDVFA